MNNLRLELFGSSHTSVDGNGSGKMKKLFPNRNKGKHASGTPTIEHPDQMVQSGRTLDRIVNAKEEARRKWECQEEQFIRRRREHEMALIALEEAEVARREEEVRKRNDDCDDKKRKNRMVQDAVAAQIRTLQEKLDEYKINHKVEEETMEDEIANLEDTLSDVKATLEKRKQELQDEIQAAALAGSQAYGAAPSAPSPTDPSVYPTLPSLGRSLENCAIQKSGAPQLQSQTSRLSHPDGAFGVPAPTPRASKGQGSSGSSPQMSHASSSRSATPNKGSESSDFDSSV